MEILQQIQQDLVSQNATLSSTLRKAMVLAHQLKSETLKTWASCELNGYASAKELPDYRKIATNCVGKWTNGHWLISARPVPLWKVDNQNLMEALRTFHVFDGVRTLEELALEKELLYCLPADMLALVNTYVAEQGYGYMEVQYTVRPHHFEQILDTVKNRLLDFVLELDTTWHTGQSVPARQDLEHMVAVYIYNNQQGGEMAVFDQRGQNVNTQYNVAGSMNIAAIENRVDFVDELIKIKEEFDRAVAHQVFDEETAIEADSKLKLAVTEAKKSQPDKQTLLDRINGAKMLIEGVTAAGGLVTALSKLAEVVQKFF